LGSEEEDDGVRMVHLINQKLEEVQRKVNQRDLMVQAMVQQGIGRWLQQTMERLWKVWVMKNQRT